MVLREQNITCVRSINIVGITLYAAKMLYIYMIDINKTIIGIDTRTMETNIACSQQ